ncbi:MAG TPA: hypothetical protein VD884_14325 [Ohtaekwangia sp.]|nr:hypothetical protein [Ohtaekwangia sp.]
MEKTKPAIISGLELFNAFTTEELEGFKRSLKKRRQLENIQVKQIKK